MSFGEGGAEDILGTIAPIVATAIGGPLAGAAVSAAVTGMQGGDLEESLTSGVITGVTGSLLGGMGGGEAAGVAGDLGPNSFNAMALQAGKETAKEGAKGIGSKLAMGSLATSVASNVVGGISASNTAKANRDIQKQRNARSMQDFDQNSRAIGGQQLASAGASGLTIDSFEGVFNSQAVENSRKRKSLAFENAVSIEEIKRQKKAAFIEPAFKTASSLLDFGTERKKRNA